MSELSERLGTETVNQIQQIANEKQRQQSVHIKIHNISNSHKKLIA